MNKKGFIVTTLIFIIFGYIAWNLTITVSPIIYKEDMKEYRQNDRIKLIGGKVTDMEIDERGVYSIWINYKEVRLEDHISNYGEQEKVYDKIDVNDTVKIYKSHRIERNGKDIYLDKPSKLYFYYLSFGLIFFGLGIVVLLVSGMIVDMFILDKLEVKWENWKQKRTDKILVLEGRIRKLENNNTQIECESCGTFNPPIASYCCVCGIKLKK